MKKITWALAGLLALNVGTGFAAPINNLSTQETAVGITLHNSNPDSDTFYIEHKISPNFTLGYQSIDWDGAGDMDDIYGQVHLTDNLRALIGDRDFGGESKFYLGLAVNGPIAPQWDGYVSAIAASNHKEFQVGANYQLTHNVDLNINYRSLRPDGDGDNINGLGIGATLKF